MPASKTGDTPAPALINAPNSEVSEVILLRCAGAPAAVRDMQHVLRKEDGKYRKLRYDKILTNFKLEELVSCAYGDGFLFLTLSFCLDQ